MVLKLEIAETTTSLIKEIVFRSKGTIAFRIGSVNYLNFKASISIIVKRKGNNFQHNYSRRILHEPALLEYDRQSSWSGAEILKMKSIMKNPSYHLKFTQCNGILHSVFWGCYQKNRPRLNSLWAPVPCSPSYIPQPSNMN